MMMEDIIQKLKEISNEEKVDVSEKITELTKNKQLLDEIYAEYQFKLKELVNLLDDYDKSQQISRIHLRKMQLWLKLTYSKLEKEVF